MLRSILTAVAMVFAIAGAAQAADKTPDKASPAEIAEARATADRIIAKFGVADIFENATTDNVPKIRHKASGMTCGFDDEHSADIQVYPGMTRGDDVSCGGKMVDFTVTTYATRAPAGATLDQLSATVGQALKTAYPDIKPYTGKSAEMTEKDGPPVRSGRFVMKMNGKPVWSYAGVSLVKGWMVEVRCTGPLDQPMQGDLFAGISMITLVNDVNGTKP
jgi:hypothetical protein